MDSHAHLMLKASDRSYFAILKKEIHTLAVTGKFSIKKAGEIDIVVAEMVSNLLKHAKGGIVLTKLFNNNDRNGMEIICMDEGPGIADISRMMTDGMSTKNTLGHGLGAMKRLSDEFQLYTQKDWGTIILSRIFTKQSEVWSQPALAEIRSLLVPKPGLTICGDGFYTVTTPEHIKLFLGDGLGHGIEANKAVVKAGEAFMECTETSPGNIIRYIDESVKRTRGLVGAVAVFDLQQKKWSMCGVGNINTRIISAGKSKTYMPYNGIIGLNVPNTLNEQAVLHEYGQHIVMCSDGIKSRWDLARHPAILRYDLSLIAAVIMKDFARYTDDMSVAICKLNF